MVSPTLGREVMLRRREAVVADASGMLRQIGAGLRDDAIMARCCGAGEVQTKFTLSVADARALADEIARLQQQDAAALTAPGNLSEELGQPWGLVCCIALMGLSVLAIPVGLSILGLMP